MVIGTRADGTVEVCRAKPENRGKGRCFHVSHVELTKDRAEEMITRVNERILSETLGSFSSVRSESDTLPDNITENHISTHAEGKVLSREELLENSHELANQISSEEWTYLRNFRNDLMENMKATGDYTNMRSIEKIHSFLISDNPYAVKTREFLGEKIDLKEFSKILTHQVKSMTSPIQWSKKRTPINRVILTNLNNDMNKERYFASVMFFGGRCCYCNRVLKKTPPPSRQASGEHITPISPENGNIHGATKFGNMALACQKCNGDRGNTELVEWLRKTKCINNEEKPKVLARIEAFRRFALYHEYTPEEDKKIDEAIDRLTKKLDSLKKEHGNILPDQVASDFKDSVKVAIIDLQHELNIT